MTCRLKQHITTNHFRQYFQANIGSFGCSISTKICNIRGQICTIGSLVISIARITYFFYIFFPGRPPQQGPTAVASMKLTLITRSKLAGYVRVRQTCHEKEKLNLKKVCKSLVF